MSISMKPSEKITAGIAGARENILVAILAAAFKQADLPWDAGMRAEFLASEVGKMTMQAVESAAIHNCVLLHLDEEAERRKVWELSVEERLAKLESAGGVHGAYGAASPIPCARQMPEPEIRVLFFVAAQLPQSWRWKTGRYVPSGRGGEPEQVWRDDETSVGDKLKFYTADQVTHWMPLPGEPT